MFSSVTGSEFPDFPIVATLGIIEINTIGLSKALTSETAGWQRLQRLEALEVGFLALDGILVSAR